MCSNMLDSMQIEETILKVRSPTSVVVLDSESPKSDYSHVFHVVPGQIDQEVGFKFSYSLTSDLSTCWRYRSPTTPPPPSSTGASSSLPNRPSLRPEGPHYPPWTTYQRPRRRFGPRNLFAWALPTRSSRRQRRLWRIFFNHRSNGCQYFYYWTPAWVEILIHAA